jgi:hypothetical protein
LLSGGPSRYEPFVSLASHFLNYRKPSGLTFLRNDPKLIQGSVAGLPERKLDVVLVSAKSPQLDDGAELSEGPTVGFCWDGVHCSVEFKVKEGSKDCNASHSLPVPPGMVAEPRTYL